MNLTRRSMLGHLGLGGIALGLGSPLAAPAVEAGEPGAAGFDSRRIVVPPSMADVSSAFVDANGHVVQPARELPVFQKADVAVVGGGAAGWAAALAAARAGAHVALLERDSGLGGLWTNGGVLVVLATGVLVDGKFNLLARGLCDELLVRLSALGSQAITPRPAAGRVYQPTANPEAVKMVMDQMLLEAKVDVFFHSAGVDVIQSGKVLQGVVFESKQGRQAVLAKTVVDASGDGDVIFQSGEAYQELQHGCGFTYRVGNLDRIDRKAARAAHKYLGSPEPLPSAAWFSDLGPRGTSLNVRAASRMEMDHRLRVWNEVQALRAVPGCSEAFLMQTCTQLGARSTRLLDGIARVTKADADAARRYSDAVAVLGDDTCRHPECSVPYGALLPKSVENLLAAGRCVSCSADLVDRVRLIAPCLVTGQAAGCAAALAARLGVTPRNVPVPDLQALLRKQGAWLG